MIKLFYTGFVCGVNDKYKLSRGRLILNSKYRYFRDDMAWTFSLQSGRPKIQNHVIVIIRMWLSPRMDSDALLKPIFDALQHGEIIANDNQIRKYAVEKNDARSSDPHLEIEVSEI